MKIALVVTVFLICSLYAEEPLPKGATRVGPDAYTFVDKDGKKKLVTQTPFGSSVKDADPAPEESRPKPAGTPHVKVEEKGDVITFRRQTPFGESVWKRKRSELSEVEKRLMSAQEQPSK